MYDAVLETHAELWTDQSEIHLGIPYPRSLTSPPFFELRTMTVPAVHSLQLAVLIAIAPSESQMTVLL